MNYHKLSEYDYDLLTKARALIERVYGYHYGDSYMRKEIKRLETIIKKLDYIFNKGEWKWKNILSLEKTTEY